MEIPGIDFASLSLSSIDIILSVDGRQASVKCKFNMNSNNIKSKYQFLFNHNSIFTQIIFSAQWGFFYLSTLFIWKLFLKEFFHTLSTEGSDIFTVM